MPIGKNIEDGGKGEDYREKRENLLKFYFETVKTYFLVYDIINIIIKISKIS